MAEGKADMGCAGGHAAVHPSGACGNAGACAAASDGGKGKAAGGGKYPFFPLDRFASLACAAFPDCGPLGRRRASVFREKFPVSVSAASISVLSDCRQMEPGGGGELCCRFRKRNSGRVAVFPALESGVSQNERCRKERRERMKRLREIGQKERRKTGKRWMAIALALSFLVIGGGA